LIEVKGVLNSCEVIEIKAILRSSSSLRFCSAKARSSSISSWIVISLHNKTIALTAGPLSSVITDDLIETGTIEPVLEMNVVLYSRSTEYNSSMTFSLPSVDLMNS
jgi:hypothetical protein